MARRAPFERSPRLAIAVSGGPDSLALCLLADRWARARGGAVVGLIVDHGLRPSSTGEACQAASWLAARGIEQRILLWRGPKPTTGIQAAARAARYELLAGWCRATGVLHLLLAHHQDDQAETLTLRAARASGPDGLAGMAAVREIAGLRLLRPLLDVPKSALLAVLAAERQAWIDDPSNRAPAFARTRLRRGPDLNAAGLGRLAQARASARAVDERAAAVWLARHARIDGAGFVLLDRAAFGTVADELAQRVLQQTLLAVGGGHYPPRRARLERLLGALRRAPGRGGWTLAGCRILPRAGHLLVCREAGVVVDVLAPREGVWQRWDRRFAVRVRGRPDGLEIRALGVEGWRLAHGAAGAARPLPPPVRESLPGLWRGAALLAAPQLGLTAPGLAGLTFDARYQPPQPLAGAPFAAGQPYDAAAVSEQTFASEAG
jgi:tRNA(Ile)-lysidine synthase